MMQESHVDLPKPAYLMALNGSSHAICALLVKTRRPDESNLG
jgi:hypothetical protein